jgi:hypothetical protein
LIELQPDRQKESPYGNLLICNSSQLSRKLLYCFALLPRHLELHILVLADIRNLDLLAEGAKDIIVGVLDDFN